jgi:hypothetical protein
MNRFILDRIEYYGELENGEFYAKVFFIWYVFWGCIPDS